MGKRVMTKEGGKCTAFPDTCKTPPHSTPKPFKNIASPSDGSGSKKVRGRGHDVLRQGDTIRMSDGDKQGSYGGLISSKFMGKAQIQAGSNKVKAEGKKVAHHTVRVSQNGASTFNADGLNDEISQMLIEMGVDPDDVYVTGFDVLKDAEDMLKCSPTLQAQIAELKAKGYSISYGQSGKGSKCQKVAKKITVDPKYADNPAGLTKILAHEAGHARSTISILKRVGMPGAEYVSRNLPRLLADEGAAALNNCAIRDEIMNSPEPGCTGEDIGINGPAGIDGIAKDKSLSESQKQQAIGKKFEKHPPSSNPKTTYKQKYKKTLEGHVSKNPDLFT